MLAKPQKQKLCNSATPPRILVAAGCERRLMSIKDSYLYFSPLATQCKPALRSTPTPIHVCTIDGVFSQDPDATLRFHRAIALSDSHRAPDFFGQ